MLLEVRHLKAYIESDNGDVKAVDDVSFTVQQGETIGIVGESGSGKSILALSLAQLNPNPPVFYPQGEIIFEGKNLLKLDERQLRQIRGNEIAMIFQDPMSSLNPIYRIGSQLIEAIRAHRKLPKSEAEKQAVELLRDVGIPDPERRMKDYPHQLSGGMRQRVMIAIALACRPKLLIADEPTTALDVTIQAQILELMKSIQKKYGTALLIITHDLGVVAKLADRVLVMYSGKIVEQGDVEDIFYHTGMPYTWSLLRSMPNIHASADTRLIPIQGQPPNLISPPKGCNFSPRCPFVTDRCVEREPSLKDLGNNHAIACVLSKEEFESRRIGEMAN
ncbi:Oligopeptide transport ATP-binding protein OppD [compost metagenome]